MAPLRFAIFGTGTMAEIYAQLISQRDDATVTAFVGNTSEKTHAIARRFGAKAFPDSDFKAAFAGPETIDAVIIATPERVREAPIREATSNQVNILLEKPLADSWTEAKKLNSILRGHQKTLAMCQVLRFSPRFNALVSAIEKGQIGEIRHIYARRNSNNIRVQRVLGKTDLAFWLTPHDLDIIQWIVKSRIQKVFALTRNKATSADDFLIVSLQFENQVSAVLEISWCGPPVSSASREAVFEVRGTMGNIELEDFEMNVSIFGEYATVLTVDTYEDYVVNGKSRGYFFELIDDFVNKVKNKKRDEEVLSRAMETTRICEMIKISIAEGRIVGSDEVN